MSAAPILFPGAEAESAFRRAGLAYVYEPRGAEGPLGLVFRVERLKAKADEMWGLLTVRSTLPGLVDVLGPQRHNFLAGRGPITKDLLELFGPPAFQVEELREMAQQLTAQLLAAEKYKAVVEELGTQELAPEAPDLVEKLIQAGQTTSLFGPGGTCKGWLAIALALSVKYGIDFCGLRVRQAEPLYLDWEADRETFIRRVKAVGRGLGLPHASLLRVAPRGPLSSNVEQLAELVSEHRIGLVIHDSVGRGSSAMGEHRSYEDIAKEFQDALAVLGVDVAHLAIDHVKGDDLDRKLAGKMMGSVRKLYDARVGWEIRTEQVPEQDSLTVGLYHQKTNNTKLFAPLGFRLTFDSDEQGRATVVRFTREDVRDTPELAGRMSQPQQILALLRRGARWTADIAAELDIERHHAGVLLRRLEEQHKLVCLATGDKGAKQWSLALQERQSNGTAWGNTQGKHVSPRVYPEDRDEEEVADVPF